MTDTYPNIAQTHGSLLETGNPLTLESLNHLTDLLQMTAPPPALTATPIAHAHNPASFNEFEPQAHGHSGSSGESSTYASLESSPSVDMSLYGNNHHHATSSSAGQGHFQFNSAEVSEILTQYCDHQLGAEEMMGQYQWVNQPCAGLPSWDESGGKI